MLTRLAQSRSIFVTVLFCVFHFSLLFGQVQQLARFELPIEPGREIFTTISVQQYGLVLYRHVETTAGSQLELVQVDTALHQTWQGYIPIDRTLQLLQSQVKQNLLFLLLKDRNHISGDFLILTIHLSTGKYSTHIVKNLIPFSPTHFNLTSEAALIGGYFNLRPVIVYYNFTLNQSKVLPGFLNEPGELDQVKANPDGSIDVIVSGRNFEKKYCLWLRNYDNQGTLIKTITLTPDEKKSLIFGSSMQTANGEQVVSGVYGRYSMYSRGIFLAVVSATGEYTIRYYNFSELQRFFNYMKAGREGRIKNRIERRKLKGKKSKFNYRFLMHELIPYNNQFVMVGEAFYPHYSYSTSAYRPYNMPSYSQRIYPNLLYRDGQVFDGYNYTHAVIIGFDQNGKLLWDNSMEINDVRSMQLEKFVKLQTERNRIILLYLNNNTLRSKIINESEIIEGKKTDELGPQASEGRKIRFQETSKLDHWYKDYFFASGTRTGLVGKGIRAQEIQKIFFIDKITYK